MARRRAHLPIQAAEASANQYGDWFSDGVRDAGNCLGHRLRDRPRGARLARRQWTYCAGN